MFGSMGCQKYSSPVPCSTDSGTQVAEQKSKCRSLRLLLLVEAQESQSSFIQADGCIT